jgi:hypothetical protein
MIWLPAQSHLEDGYYAGIDALRQLCRGQNLGRNALMFKDSPAWLLAHCGMLNMELGVRFDADPDPAHFQAARHFLRLGWSVAAKAPSWLGRKDIHMSHKSHLIRIDPEYYAHRMPLNTPLELPLIWPKGS